MKAFWQRLQQRERFLVLTAGVVLMLVLAWVAVWEPLREARANAYLQAGEQRALLDWLDRLAPEVQRLRSERVAVAVPESRSTLALIDETARAAGLAGSMKRIEPAADGEVRVDFEQAPFPDLMKWLADLVASRPLIVVRFNADRAGPGRVDSSVVLGRSDIGTVDG